MPLTNDDYLSIKYFINERGDTTRWTRWESRKPAIKEVHPELIDALERLQSAERTLKAVVDSLPSEYSE